MELAQHVGFGMKNTDSVFLGLESLTNSSSFTMQRLEEIWTLRKLMVHTPNNDPAPTGTQQIDSSQTPPVSVSQVP